MGATRRRRGGGGRAREAAEDGGGAAKPEAGGGGAEEEEREPPARRSGAKRTALVVLAIAAAVLLPFRADVAGTLQLLELGDGLAHLSGVWLPVDRAASMLGGVTSPGDRMREMGFVPDRPVVIVPGITSTSLEAWKTLPCAGNAFRTRLWGGMAMVQDALSNTDCWLRHMALNLTTGLDPDGVKLRPARDLEAADYVAGAYWVWGKVLESLGAVGYDPNNLHMAAYDWRLSLPDLEMRDKYFSKLKSAVELLRMANGNRRAAVMCHSLGCVVWHYFSQWVESPGGGAGGDTWVSDNVGSVSTIGAPWLGTPKAVAGLLSGECKETAQLPAVGQYLLESLLSRERRVATALSFPSIASLLPMGGDAVWGNATWAPDDALPGDAVPSYAWVHDSRRVNRAPDGCASAAGDGGAACLAASRSAASTARDRKALRGLGRMVRVRDAEAREGGATAPAPAAAGGAAWLSDEELAAAAGRSFSSSEARELIGSLAPRPFGRFQCVAGAAEPGDAVNSRECLEDAPARRGEKGEFLRRWANPLLSPLPRAPRTSYYVLYGVGKETERAFEYEPRRDFNNTRPAEGEHPPVAHPVPLTLRGTPEACGGAEPGSCEGGVHLVDGDGTVPLVSLAYVPLRAWGAGAKTPLNPSGSPVITREYTHNPWWNGLGNSTAGGDKDEAAARVPSVDYLARGGTSSGDHVDIMGSHSLIRDLVRIVARQEPPEGRPPLGVPLERVYSSAGLIASRVHRALVERGWRV